jgi:hypothetical protein
LYSTATESEIKLSLAGYPTPEHIQKVQQRQASELRKHGNLLLVSQRLQKSFIPQKSSPYYQKPQSRDIACKYVTNNQLLKLKHPLETDHFLARYLKYAGLSWLSLYKICCFHTDFTRLLQPKPYVMM